MKPSPTDPLKWKKHLKLVEYGLRTYEDLVGRLHRFSTCDVEALCNAIRDEMKSDSQKREEAYYIIILVKKEQYYKLPNYRVYSVEDLNDFLPYINPKIHLYDEFWYCRTPYSENNKNMSVAGRMSFDYTNSFIIHTIEQIWNKSPRMIEEYNEDSKFIYLRASRPTWGYSYNYEHIHIPLMFNATTATIKKHFSETIVMIERIREKIEVFEEYMASFSFNIFSIEYQLINGKLNIIDWDSPNDRIVLE